MRQNSKVESSTPSSPAIALHPVLSLALANLDIQLEDELVRYRRQRTNVGRAVAQPKRKQLSHQLDLIAVAATSDRNSTVVTQPTSALEERLTGVAGKSIEPDAYKPIPAFTASPQPFAAAIALRTPSSPLAQDGSGNPSSLDVGDDVHALAQAANPNLDDYLESSEELLRSLADEQAEVRSERNFMQSLLTPLGLGSMLLLLLSSAMFGYVIMNPSSLGWLAIKQNSRLDSPPGQTPGQAVFPPPQPDLAKRELPELSLNNLGTVNVSPGSTPAKPSATSSQTPATPNSQPTVTAAKTAASQPSTETSVATTQAPIPAVTSSSPSRLYVRPAAPTQAASSRPVPARIPARPVQIVPSSGVSAATTSSRGTGSADAYQYKVGIPFENDQSLENARKVVPDAFVRTLPDGRTIVQIGAARSETEVKENVQGLRDQGLSSAEVYKR